MWEDKSCSKLRGRRTGGALTRASTFILTIGAGL
jgi:hypothetical protein